MKIRFVEFTQHPSGRKVSVNAQRVDCVIETEAPYVIICSGGAEQGTNVRENYTTVMRRLRDAIEAGSFH